MLMKLLQERMTDVSGFCASCPARIFSHSSFLYRIEQHYLIHDLLFLAISTIESRVS